jgi:hypothetical protein
MAQGIISQRCKLVQNWVCTPILTHKNAWFILMRNCLATCHTAFDVVLVLLKMSDFFYLNYEYVLAYTAPLALRMINLKAADWASL